MTGERVTRWWVSRYTRGLPEATRAEREAEIASDVWEHLQLLGDGARSHFALGSRCLRGVPSDLSWRRSQLRSTHGRQLPARLARGLGWASAGVGYAVLVLTHAWLATPLVGLDLYGADWEADDVEATAMISGTLLAALAAGALVLHRLPLAGAMLVATGSFGTMVVYWWMTPLTAPCGIAATTGGVILACRRRTTQLEASRASP